MILQNRRILAYVTDLPASEGFEFMKEFERMEKLLFTNGDVLLLISEF